MPDLSGVRLKYLNECDPDQMEWAVKQMTPQPFGAFQEKVTLDFSKLKNIPITYIFCTHDTIVSKKEMKYFISILPKQTLIQEIRADHVPMVSNPQGLGEILHTTSFSSDL